MTDDAAANSRDARGRFTVGNAGGPGGSRRRASEFRQAAETALSPEVLAGIMRRAARMALEGNVTAMKFVAERTLGRAPEAPNDAEPVALDLPRIQTAADCALALQRILDGTVRGTIDGATAQTLTAIVQARLKAVETQELEQRLVQLEKAAEHTMQRRT